jgi:hypothetical protein
MRAACVPAPFNSQGKTAILTASYMRVCNGKLTEMNWLRLHCRSCRYGGSATRLSSSCVRSSARMRSCFSSSSTWCAVHQPTNCLEHTHSCSAAVCLVCAY